MEKTYNPALIQRTQRYMETHSISQNQFAAKVNLSSAALSSYLNQKYKGSVEAVERQLSEFFKLDEEAEAAAEKTASLLPRAAYVPTSISEDVCQSIRFAQLEHCMVVLHGDAGVGKSKGAQKFLRDHPTNAVGISITPSTGTLNGSIKLLARALRVPECRNKMDQMMALRSRLDGTNWVIVIDEAQHLKYAALEEIRSLTDDNPMTGEHGVGVVLIGNADCPKDVARLEDMLVKADEDLVLVDCNIGPVIGCHVGPDMIAVAFWGKDRRETVSVVDRIANKVKKNR